MDECCMYLAGGVTFHCTQASYSTFSPIHMTLGSKSKVAKVVDLFHIT